MRDLSILIPARHEQFLNNTIESILKNKRGNTEIIVGLDGEWGTEPIPDHDDVTIVYYSESIGQRAITNQCARLSDARYLMKLDAHCSFDEGFDVKMIQEMHDDWTMVPLMKNLHAFDWVCKKCKARKYQGPTPEKCWGEDCDSTEFEKDIVWQGKKSPNSTAYRFDTDLHFQYWGGYKKLQKGDLVETMSLQGSCWMLTRDKYWELDICDEGYGSWGQQGVEVSMKTKLSGGKVICNKKTWYAHMFRTQGGDFGFPYKRSGNAVKKARKYSQDIWLNNKWDKQIYPFSSVIEYFYPIPGWTEENYKALKINEMKVKRAGIYSIVNTVNNKIYIGSAINLSRRFSEHLRELQRNAHYNDHLQKSWNKYGKESFSFNIEYFCNEEDLIVIEQQYIDAYSKKIVFDSMYNINPSATSNSGCKHTQKSLDKMRIQQSDQNNGFYGKEHTEETKLKIGKTSSILTVNRKRDKNGRFIKDNRAPTKGLVYYTNHTAPLKISRAVQKQLLSINLPIVSASLKPMPWFGKNIRLPLKSGYLTMFTQILAALEASDADIVFLVEHDVLYHKSHFDFVPPKKDVFYYNVNIWKWNLEKKYGVKVDDCRQTSGLCAYRELLLQHYKKRIKMVTENGFTRKMGFEPGTHNRKERVDDYKSDIWESESPNVDIRHKNTLTSSRWSKEQYRNSKYTVGWQESTELPDWDILTSF